MKPVDQTKFVEQHGDGNCFAACVASILERPIEEMPVFTQPDWFWRWQDWLAERGLYMMEINHPMEKCCVGLNRPSGIHIMNGKSTRGDWEHAVVAFNGKLLHDPHPSRAGIKEVTSWTILIPLNPALALKEVVS